MLHTSLVGEGSLSTYVVPMFTSLEHLCGRCHMSVKGVQTSRNAYHTLKPAHMDSSAKDPSASQTNVCSASILRTASATRHDTNLQHSSEYWPTRGTFADRCRSGCTTSLRTWRARLELTISMRRVLRHCFTPSSSTTEYMDGATLA